MIFHELWLPVHTFQLAPSIVAVATCIRRARSSLMIDPDHDFGAVWLSLVVDVWLNQMSYAESFWNRKAV